MIILILWHLYTSKPKSANHENKCVTVLPRINLNQ
jgi:hypothetical protein